MAPNGDSSEIRSQRASSEVYCRPVFAVAPEIGPYRIAEEWRLGRLLHRREIDKLWDEVRKKGVTIIPTRVYLKNGRAKIEIAVAKGKKQYDKRQAIAKRDTQREIERQLKNQG